MPTMEIINERFARNIRIGLFNLIRKSPEVSIGGIKVQKYSAFLREIVVPTNFNIVSVKPLRGSGLIVCDPTLVFAVIDALFGIGIQLRVFRLRIRLQHDGGACFAGERRDFLPQLLGNERNYRVGEAASGFIKTGTAYFQNTATLLNRDRLLLQ